MTVAIALLSSGGRLMRYTLAGVIVAPLLVSAGSAATVTSSSEGAAFSSPAFHEKGPSAEVRNGDEEGIRLAQSGGGNKGKKGKKKRRSGQAGGEGGGDAAQKALFYRKRGKQAQKEGRLTDAVEDMRKALEALRGARINPKKRQSILKDAAFVEHQIGRTKKAIRIMEDASAIRPNPVTYRGLAYMYASQGDIERARAASEKAKSTIQQIFMIKRPPSEKRLQLEAESHRMDAFLLELQGRWADAEVYLRKELDALAESGKMERDPSLRARRHGGLARNLIRQGRLREAEVTARTALNDALDKIGTDNSVTGDIARKLAATLTAQGRAEDAEQTIRDAIDIYQNAGLSDRQSKLRGARRDLASILAFQAEWTDAADEFARIEKVMKPEGFTRMLGKTPSLAIALIKTGRTAEILPHLEDAHRHASQQFGEKHPRATLARVTLATALARAGKHADALVHFTSGIPLMLSKSRPIDDENASAQERWKTVFMEAYIGLLTDIRGTELEKSAGIDTMAVAFRLADTARGRRVQSAIAASGARAMAVKPELADLVRREQDSRKQTAALNSLLAQVLSKPQDEQVSDVVADLKERIDKHRDTRGDLMATIERRYPDYASLINPQPAAIDDARKALKPDEALVAFFVGEERSFVWAVPKSGSAHFAAIDAGEEDIDDTVALIRGALEPNAETLGDIPPFDVETAYGAYQQLLEPVEDGWKSAANLVVVAHGPLGWLPLTVLPTKTPVLAAAEKTLFAGYREVLWLVRDHAVSRVPSVSALTLLRKLPPGKSDRKPFAGFGDPFFNAGQKGAPSSSTRPAGTGDVKTRGMVLVRRAAPIAAEGEGGAVILDALPRLPDTAEEIRGIALALNADPSQTLFTGEKASEGFVKKADLSGFKVLAFATHGLVPGELEGLQEPALALSSPAVAGGGDDGLLTMSEILALRLDADWVILSACNTGAANGAGAEAVSGLGRAFFYAGTRSLLVSNWPVESASARKLTTELFRVHAAEPTLPRAQALRKSMLSLIDGPGFVDDGGKSVFSYAHPLFWAPFSLIGDGGVGS